MAIVKLVGLQNLDFETRDGKLIQGIKLHFTAPDENVMGHLADSKFINSVSCANLGITIDSLSPFIGKDIEIDTNLKGNITGVKPVDKSR